MTAPAGDGGPASPFDDLLPYAAALAALPCSWAVASGWAVDLFLGRVTRGHADVDVAVYRHDQAEVYQALRGAGWSLEKVVEGRLERWGGERLDLPVHEVHARRPRGEPAHLELLLNEGDAECWRYRRAPRISRPRALVELRSSEGIPFLSPEVVLLFKSARLRPRDELDFAACLPALAAESRAWLHGALASLDPEHLWLPRLLS